MKKLIALVLALIMILGVVSITVSAASYQNGSYTVTAKSGVNVRKGAGTGYSKVGAAKNGTTFTVTQISGDWGYTSSIACTNGTKSGWVCLTNCKYNGSTSRSSYNDVFASVKGYGYSLSDALSSQSTTFEKGTWVYVWGWLHDINDNLYKSYSNNTCNMTLTLYKPDGSVAFSYTYNDSDNNWIGCELDQTGTWKIQSKISGYLYGTNTQTISVINTYTSESNSGKPRNGAFVRIQYAYNGKYLDVPAEAATMNGTQLQVWDSAPQNTNQYFWLNDTGNGWQIISLHSGKVIEVRNSSHQDCAQVAQWDMHTLACARWSIIENSDGTVSFKNMESDLFLNVCGGGNAGNGTKMIQYHDDGSVAMRFYIKPISLGGYTTSTQSISGDSIKTEKDISITSWHPLEGLTETMLQQDDDLEALVENIPVFLDVSNFALSWITNSKEVTRIHVIQGTNKKMTIQYGTSIEANLSGKQLSLDTLLVNRYYNFSPTIIFSAKTKADECIRNWFDMGGNGKYSMNLKFGKIKIGEYGYNLLIDNGIIFQVPIIQNDSSYIVYYSENGKTIPIFDAADILRNAKLQLATDEAAVVVKQLIKNGYID